MHTPPKKSYIDHRGSAEPGDVLSLTLSKAKCSLYDVVFVRVQHASFAAAGLLLLSCVKQKRWWKSCRHTDTSSQHVTNITAKKVDTLFAPDELQTLERFRRFQNNPLSLFKLAVPCLVSIGVGPFAVLLVPEMWDFFFPFDDSRKGNINGTLSPFLLPASLVYSLSWGFALQDAFAKFDVTDANAKHHLALLRHIRELVLHSRSIPTDNKRTLLSKLCRCTTQWMLRQMGERNQCKCKAFPRHLLLNNS